MLKWIVRFLLIFCCTFSLAAQSELSYSYNLENGLPSSYIKQIRQISSGELLISTDNGLVVYNGYTYQTFSTAQGLPSIYVKTVLIDRTGKLWVGTDGGLVVSESAEPNKIKFRSFIVDPNNSSLKALRLFMDSKNRIWVASDQGVYFISNEKVQKLSFDKPLHLLADFVRSFAFEEDRAGNIWITTLGEGLFVYKNDGDKIKSISISGLPKIVRTVYKYSEDIFWLGTSEGLYQFEPNITNPQLSLVRLLLSKPTYIDVITKFSDDSYYLGTDGFGYSVYNPKTRKTVRGELVSSDYVKDVFVDRLQNVWVGTDDGLTVFPYSLFDNISIKQGLPKRYVSGIVEDKNGTIWIATYGGIYKRSKGSEDVVWSPENMRGWFVKILLYDEKNDKIYVFTQQEVYVLDTKSSAITFLTKISSQYQIENAYLEDESFLWIGTTTEVLFRYRFSDQSLDSFGNKNGLKVQVRAIQKRPNNSLVFSGADRALYIFNNSTMEFLPLVNWSNQQVKPDSLAVFDAMAEDQWNRLWIGGTDGVYWLDRSGNITKPNFPKEMEITNLRFLVGRGTQFWIGTNRGLFLTDLDENGNLTTVRSFGKNDGLLSTSFSYRSGFLVESGRFWMGTNLSVSYYTGQPFRDKLEPIQLVEWKANDQIFSSTETEELESGNEQVSFKVVSMNYPTENILYQYRLLGLNDMWSAPTKERLYGVTLTSAGTYEFQARAVTNGGLTTDILSVRFSIPSPVWLRWWAFVLYILVFSLGTYFFINQRSKALQKKNDELEQFVTERTQEITQRDHELTKILAMMDQKGSLLSNESIRLNKNIAIMGASSIQQSSAVAETTATMEELAQSNKTIAQSAEEVANMMVETKDIIESGKQQAKQSSDHILKVQQANEEQVKLIQTLSTRAENIRNIANFVANINDQTQLIAFNAAIEATVSGEVGRRFKVIADEIRELANEINNSTKEINKTLNEMSEEISEVSKLSSKNKTSMDESVRLIEEVNTSFTNVSTAAGYVNDLMLHISNSTSQQNIANDQMVTGLKEIGESANYFVEVMKEITETSQQMEDTAKYFLDLRK